jgi:NAD(P)-dependent dehydrogenase (short-subunit alcohol dehydrogenase family)
MLSAKSDSSSEREIETNEPKQRVAVVTGAASGIGLALARRFAGERMRVVLADVDGGALERAEAELRDSGAQTLAVRTDVSSVADVNRLAERAVDTFGAVHIVCNNAGVDSGAPFSEVPLETWRWVLEVNFFGVLHGCRTFLPLLREHGRGHIVNTSSVAALTGSIPTGTPYVASKFAVLGLSENLHHELAADDPGIGVSVLCPAFVRTEMPRSERNRPPGVPALDDHPRRRPIVDFARSRVAAGLSPDLVAVQVLDAIRERRFWVLPHPDEARAAVQARLRWILDGTPPPPRPGRPVA